jgi:hypothetical protein
MFRSIAIALTLCLADVSMTRKIGALAGHIPLFMRKSIRNSLLTWLIAAALLPASAFAAGIVYAVNHQGAIQGFDATTGSTVSTFGSVRIDRGLAFGNGIVYAVHDGGAIIAFDATSGARVEPGFWSTYDARPFDHLAFGNGIVYGVNDHGHILGFDAISGAWVSDFYSGTSEGGLAFGNGILYNVNHQGLIQGIDPTSGAVVSTFGHLASIAINRGLAFGDGIVYAANINGQIVAYDATSGARVQVNYFSDRLDALAFGNGIIYGTNDYGIILGHDAISGVQVSTFNSWQWGGGLTYGALVPIPPAVWLFGSALGLMGVMRRL